MERKPLGRGLSSLLGGQLPDENSTRVIQVDIEEISPNLRQPRQEWDEGALADLSESIKVNGILQPLLIRGRPGSYELVAGERRLRAAKMAGLARVPAILKETDDRGSLKLALIENIQRQDLSAVDSARAYQALIDEFRMTQEEVAQAVGKSRSGVANTLRLLRLPPAMLESLRAGTITEGHARTLLSLEDTAAQNRLWKLALDGASVREMEAAVRKLHEPAQPSPAAAGTASRPAPRRNPHLEDLQERLRRALGIKVQIRGDEQAGTLSLEYYSEDDLQNLADRLMGEG